MSDDLEKLFAEASLPESEARSAPATDQEASRIPLIHNHGDHPRPCEHGSSAKNLKICRICFWPYCEECASILDPSFCKLCLNEPLAELVELPLKDAEGVTHEGRELKPAPTATFFQPRFGTLAKSVSEMSDFELDAHIDQYKELVRQGEKALDFRRVVLGSMQVESAQRGDARRRQLRSDKTKYPVRTVAISKDGQKKISTASMTQMLEMLKALDKLQKDKQNKQQEKSKL